MSAFGTFPKSTMKILITINYLVVMNDIEGVIRMIEMTLHDGYNFWICINALCSV